MISRLYDNNIVKDDHIFRLTDDTGMLQHSKCWVPDPRHGYTTDDNARALIMSIMLYKTYGEKKYVDLIYRYSSFLLNAQNEQGKFKNFMSYDRKWLEDEGSEDCFGRCIWALGYALSSEYTPKGVKQALTYVFKKALPNIKSLSYPRAKAYSVIGLSFLDNIEIKNLIYDMAQSLCCLYDKHADNDWKWFENTVTYCNSVLPWSLFAAYRVMGNNKFLETAEESMSFLENILFKEGYFKPVGCNGWLTKGGKAAEFDEQPVEACEAVLAYMEAYEATGNGKYLKKAKDCHAWYEGSNSKGLCLIENETGGCFDGLTAQGVNHNMGAESIISYIISCLSIYQKSCILF
ncbi:MAG TPA: glycosyltransferase [Clostridiaceae bacterium]|nr:glycosyltransferase [Clostridiaceae bacterium]